MATKNISKLPESLPEDLRQLKKLSDQFAEKSIDAARFQAFRVPQGIYEQRESGSYMLRARLVAGLISPEQLRAASRVAREFGDGVLHLTTRQDLQIHGVPLENIHPATSRLVEAGLSSKGGGGNTVRNIAACQFAGVCPDEVFDITPHVAVITENLLNDPISYQLPRKYKIAYSGCSRDCAGATINDLGFISKKQGDQEGFTVYIAGGMGARSSTSVLLEEWVPTSDALRIAEAVKRVFDKHGDRKNRSNARLRFLIKDVGIEKFKALYRSEFNQLASFTASPTSNNVPEVSLKENAAFTNVQPLPDFDKWRRSSVIPQKQSGYFSVEIAPALGLFKSDELEALAGIVEQFGEGALRATNRQSAVLRWVAEAELPAIHAQLSKISESLGAPETLQNVLACAGAATCRLGIGLSRGLAGAILEKATQQQLNLRDSISKTSIHISGCPNSCGRHPIAQIGLYGAARRVNGRLAPHYVAQFGGHV